MIKNTTLFTLIVLSLVVLYGCTCLNGASSNTVERVDKSSKEIDIKSNKIESIDFVFRDARTLMVGVVNWQPISGGVLRETSYMEFKENEWTWKTISKRKFNGIFIDAAVSDIFEKFKSVDQKSVGLIWIEVIVRRVGANNLHVFNYGGDQFSLLIKSANFSFDRLMDDSLALPRLFWFREIYPSDGLLRDLINRQ